MQPVKPPHNRGQVVAERARLAYQKKRAEIEQVFGLPVTSKEIVMAPQKQYGLAVLTEKQHSNWNFLIGSFPFLHGFLSGLDFLETDRDHESFLNCAFFLLDNEGAPIELIDQIIIEKPNAWMVNKDDQDYILRDLIHIENPEVETFNYKLV